MNSNENYYCDVCGSTIDVEDACSITNQKVPVFYSRESTEFCGKYPHFNFENVDLCSKCAMQAFGRLSCNAWNILEL